MAGAAPALAPGRLCYAGAPPVPLEVDRDYENGTILRIGESGLRSRQGGFGCPLIFATLGGSIKSKSPQQDEGARRFVWGANDAEALLPLDDGQVT
jgi:hypothetical protein